MGWRAGLEQRGQSVPSWTKSRRESRGGIVAVGIGRWFSLEKVIVGLRPKWRHEKAKRLLKAIGSLPTSLVGGMADMMRLLYRHELCEKSRSSGT